MLRIETVQAHCDIPCKIYDPSLPQVAALSVARLLDLIQEIDLAGGSDVAQAAQLSRLVSQKEEQATIVKDEVRIIWGDYFKDPQIEAFPDIHALVHSIMMTASKCKQNVDPANGVELVSMVNRFAEIFWETKGVKTKMVTAPYPPALPVAQPILEDA